MSRIGERVPPWLTGAAALALVIYFFGYDLRQRAAGGVGDNIEALEIGAKALLELHDPYAFSTHTGNPIAPLLGGIILALPLYALMKSLFLYTMLSWVGAAWLAERVSPRTGLAVVVLVAASPWSRATLPYLNDNGITALWVVVFSAWGYSLARQEAGILVRLLWTGGFACALDYRWTMWVICLPYFALFYRSFGWRKALTWLVPVMGATLFLFLAPAIGPSGGYWDRTLVTLMQHSDSATGALPSTPVVALVAIVVVAASLLARTLAGVFAATSLALGTLLVGMSLLWLPAHSLQEAFYRYHFSWYLGWVLVFGIAALIAPDARQPRIDRTRLQLLRRIGFSWPKAGRFRPRSSKAAIQSEQPTQKT